MDLIKQNKFIGWVIGVLIAINIITLTIIWIQSDKKNPRSIKDSGNASTSSVKLLQSEIGLTDDQAQKFQESQDTYRERNKITKDDLDSSKLLLADELFNPNSDPKRVDSIASRIGVLQSKVEITRFEHFKGLVKMCNNEQKEKLRPILREIYAKKGSPEKQDDKQRPGMKKESGELKSVLDDRREKRQNENRDDQEIKHDSEKSKNIDEEHRPPNPDDRSGPPTPEEKLKRYTKRLSLSPDQIEKVRNILETSRKKGEEFRANFKPGMSGFESEKNKTAKEEDDLIFRVLNEDQKTEYEKIVRNRMKRLKE
jgi:hypothetical protein